MKRIISLFLLSATLGFGQAALDVSLQQVNNAGTEFVEKLVPYESQVTSGSLASWRSGVGLGTEDSPSFTSLGLTGYLQIANQAAPATPTSAGRLYWDTSNRLSWIGTNGFTRTFDGTANTANRIYTLPDAAGTVLLDSRAVIPSSNTSGIQLYNTADQTTNYERLEVLWSGNAGILRTVNGGTGTARDLSFAAASGNAVFASGTKVVTRNTANWISFQSGTTEVASIYYDGSTRAAWSASAGSLLGWRTDKTTAGNPFRIYSAVALTNTSGSSQFLSIEPIYNQASGTASNTDLLINRTETAVGSGTQNLIDAQVGGSSRFAVRNSGKPVFDTTVTAGGTTGNQTINKPTGTVNFAAAATSLTVTNSLCTTNSIVFAVIRTNDSTATIKNVVPGSGSFVINLAAAATAETSVGFLVVN